MAPFCRWNADQSFCDSTLCPLNATEAECSIVPSQCDFYDAGNGMPSACVDSRCGSQMTQQRCNMPVQSPTGPSYAPAIQSTIRKCTVRSNSATDHNLQRDHCLQASIRCSEFATQDDCNFHAPARLCRWNATASVNGTAGSGACLFISGLTCPDGSKVDGIGPNAQPLMKWPCEPDEAIEVRTNPHLPTLAAITWQKPSDPHQIPDLIQFSKAAPEGTASKMRDPLWRQAVDPLGATCFQDFRTSVPTEINFVPPQIEEPIKFNWECSRTNWIGSFETRLLQSRFWQMSFAMNAPPMPYEAQSQFQTISDGVTAAFIDKMASNASAAMPNGTGVIAYINYESYFNQCKPKQCTFVERKRPSPQAVLGNVFGTLGGLTVIIRFVITTVFGFLLVGISQQYVKARPEAYPEAHAFDKDLQGEGVANGGESKDHAAGGSKTQSSQPGAGKEELPQKQMNPLQLPERA